jgi:aminoglycoside phosphotransferase (APT) family kinase protein
MFQSRTSWLSAVQALAALGSISPSTIGLSNFGPSTDYFPRQIKSLSRVSRAQAAAIDIESGKPTGDIPFYHEIIAWYQQNLPDEKKLGLRIVHGDYKLDNLVFHPTENHVIGILDWELCTLGCPVIYPRALQLPSTYPFLTACRSWELDTTMVYKHE